MKHRYRNSHDDFEIVNGKQILRDGRTYRAGPVTMMDSGDNLLERALRQHDAGPMRVVDAFGSTTFNRPGYRFRVGDAIGQYEKERAYAEYDRRLCDSYKSDAACVPDSRADAASEESAEQLCPNCNGSGEADDGRECESCNGTGFVESDYERSTEEAECNMATHRESTPPRRRADAASVAQQMKDHQDRMNELYSRMDRDLEQRWRTP